MDPEGMGAGEPTPLSCPRLVAPVACTDQLSYHPGPQAGLGLAQPIYPI